MTVGMNNVEQSNDVGVAHLLEERDLPDGGAGDALIVGFEADLLEGDNAAVVGEIAGLVNDTVSTCSFDSQRAAPLSETKDRRISQREESRTPISSIGN